ncbi:MAG: tRNA preQ1(34) S-adenosylmethionine ribosyltransferase-isomerase QueA [Armatimonadetes bacterium]|nr:tRNA preQ1(34) S-adenosylmethionine ribosyltransferase-isomerase QueA [Armatimonadota bacterium]
MNLSDFDFELPEELIAQEPLEDRSASRLLCLNKESGAVEHRQFKDILEFLHPGDLLVVNNTRVTAKRLFGEKTTGGKVEALVLSNEPEPFTFRALMRPGKRLRPGAIVEFGHGLRATILKDAGEGQKIIRFDELSNFGEAMEQFGEVPLPPYIHHRLDSPERYQTVFNKVGGSSAAPTAALHFSEELIAKLKSNGVKFAEVTLDVGIDTFRPVAVENLDEHVMHGETCRISDEAAETINSSMGRIIAVGTTSVRTLESFAIGTRRVASGEKNTQIFIKPGYKFQVVEAMFTNFHLPKTTMLMMISAMASREAVISAYNDAVRNGYRFLSFGDSMYIS